MGQDMNVRTNRLGWTPGQLMTRQQNTPPATASQAVGGDQVRLSASASAAPMSLETRVALRSGAQAIALQYEQQQNALGRTLDKLSKGIGTMSTQDLAGAIHKLQAHQSAINQWGRLYQTGHNIAEHPMMTEAQAKTLVPLMTEFAKGSLSPQYLEEMDYRLTHAADQVGRSARPSGELEEAGLRYATRVGDLKNMLRMFRTDRAHAVGEYAERLDETMHNTRHEIEVAERFVRLTQDLNRNPRATDADRKLLAAYLKQAETTGRPREALVKAEDLVRNTGRAVQTDRTLYEKTHQLATRIENREQELLQLGAAIPQATGEELARIQQRSRDLRVEIGALLETKAKVDRVAERHKPDAALTQAAIEELDSLGVSDPALQAPQTGSGTPAEQIKTLEDEERAGFLSGGRRTEIRLLKQGLAPDAPRELKNMAQEIQAGVGSDRLLGWQLIAHSHSPSATADDRALADEVRQGNLTSQRLQEVRLLMAANQPQATREMRQLAQEVRHGNLTSQRLAETGLLMEAARKDASLQMKAIGQRVRDGGLDVAQVQELSMQMETTREAANLPPLL